MTAHDRPPRLSGVTDRATLSDFKAGTTHNYFLTVNRDGKTPVEVILTSGHAGSEVRADSEALGRVVSIALQHGVPVQAFVQTLRGIDGGLVGSLYGQPVSSKAGLIALALGADV